MRAHWRIGVSVAAEAHDAKYHKKVYEALTGNHNRCHEFKLGSFWALGFVLNEAKNLQPRQDSGDKGLSLIVLCTPHWETEGRQGRCLRLRFAMKWMDFSISWV